MKSLLSGLLLSLLYVTSHGERYDIRKDELSRMGKYELIDIDINWDSSNTNLVKTVSFEAFGESYSLSLELNDKLVPSRVKHTNGVPMETNGHFVSNTESCHYQVSKSGSKSNSGKHDGSLHGGIALCEKFGVRGRILTKDDTLIIRPANYYLDLEFDSSEDEFHDFGDKHLVYKMSNYNRTGIPMFDSSHAVKQQASGEVSMIKEASNENGNKYETKPLRKHKGHNMANIQYPQVKEIYIKFEESEHYQKYFADSSDSDKGSDKDAEKEKHHKARRLLNTNQVELYVMIDPSRYEYFYDTYGSSSWYDELVSNTFTYVNDMTATYEDTNWGSGVGTISVTLVELEVVQYYSGDYASLATDCTCGSGGCTDAYDSSCTITGGSPGQLADFTTWISYNKDTSTFDNAQIWTNENLAGSAGTGWLCTVCSGSYSSNNDQMTYGYDWGVRTITHELGHNFCCDHDQDTSCGIDAGLMGYGSGEGFSSCSISSVDDYFDNGLSCLLDGVRDFSSNFGDGDTTNGGGDDTTSTVTGDTDTQTGGTDTGSTTGTDTTDDTSCYEYDCVKIQNMGDLTWGSYSYQLSDNSFNYDGCYNNLAFYTALVDGSTWYIYNSATYNYWFINTGLNDGDTWAYCWQATLAECTGGWYLYQDGYTLDSDASITDSCDETDAPTARPTANPSSRPTANPTGRPSASPTDRPTASPTDRPTASPSDKPTAADTPSPTAADTVETTEAEVTTTEAATTTEESGGDGTYTGSDDTNTDTDENECSGYSCITIYNLMKGNGYYDFNGEWVPSGCHNDQPYYTQTISGRTWYLYYSATYGSWHINYFVHDSYAWGFCWYDDLAECSGQFYVYSGGWSCDYDSIVRYCSGMASLGGFVPAGYTDTDTDSDSSSTEFNLDFDLTYNCTNDYDDYVCLYNSGILWDDIAQFKYIACKEDYPLFRYHYQVGNYSTMYYLQYQSSESTWRITESSITDTVGVAYCGEEDLSECTYETWYYNNVTEEDMSEWIKDDSMGYDSNCEVVVTDDNSAYCDSDGACAFWMFEIIIEDETYATNLCSDTDVACITEGLYATYSDATTVLECDGDYKIHINANVTFSTTQGWTIYERYTNNASYVVNQCESSDDLTTIVEYSTLHVCDDCSNFIRESDSDSAAMYSLKMAGVVAMAIIVTLF